MHITLYNTYSHFNAFDVLALHELYERLCIEFVKFYIKFCINTIERRCSTFQYERIILIHKK